MRSSDSGIQSWRRSITLRRAQRQDTPALWSPAMTFDRFRSVPLILLKPYVLLRDAIRVGFGLDLRLAAVHTISYSPKLAYIQHDSRTRQVDTDR